MTSPVHRAPAERHGRYVCSFDPVQMDKEREAKFTHPAIQAADEATALPKHSFAWAVVIVALAAFVSHFLPLGVVG